MKPRRLGSGNVETLFLGKARFLKDLGPVLGPKKENTFLIILGNIAGTGGPRIVFNYLGKRLRRPAPC